MPLRVIALLFFCNQVAIHCALHLRLVLNGSWLSCIHKHCIQMPYCTLIKIPALCHMCYLVAFSNIISVAYFLICIVWNNMHSTAYPINLWTMFCWLVIQTLCNNSKHINSSPLDRLVAISQTTFFDEILFNIFFLLWLKFHWSLSQNFQLTINHLCFRAFINCALLRCKGIPLGKAHTIKYITQ